METCELKYDKDREGWVCSCGAFYERPKGWRPMISWCMKCRKEFIIEIEEEN